MIAAGFACVLLLAVLGVCALCRAAKVDVGAKRLADFLLADRGRSR